MKLFFGTLQAFVALAPVCTVASQIASESAVSQEESPVTSSVLSAIEAHGRTAETRITLRFCNAYSFSSAMDILQKDTLHPDWKPWKLTQRSLGYKQCIDLPDAHVRAGDQFVFSVGSQHIGTFAVTEDPADGSMLQLAIYRHDTFTTTADFSSHLFVASPNPQIAIIDTYHGPSLTSLNLRSLKDGTSGQDQQLHFGKVISVRPGTYELRSATTSQGQWHIDAKKDQMYSVFRVGIEPLEGPAYPEAVFIFPEVRMAYGAAVASSLCGPLMFLAIISAVAAGTPLR